MDMCQSQTLIFLLIADLVMKAIAFTAVACKYKEIIKLIKE